ncbi:MAG TPA: AsnC family transcriptional regulator [Anaerolineaceae bacterium]|jgi:DNA-binding Lrp family transcriptional regulator|nr:AsnC family transcriptional regulator [Anaerolineaceae bacterium]
MRSRSPFDFLDYQIIQILKKDARASASEVARALDANERTIRKRIDRLVEMGAVRFTAMIEPQAFGYIITADIFMQVEPELEDSVLEHFEQMPEISYVAFGQGTQDVSIEVRFKSNADVREFLRTRLPAVPGVRVTGYALVPRILRNIDEWMPPAEDFRSTNGDE